MVSLQPSRPSHIKPAFDPSPPRPSALVSPCDRPGKGSFGLPQAAALRFITLTPQLKSVPLHGLTQG